jgi:hypothetical protein
MAAQRVVETCTLDAVGALRLMNAKALTPMTMPASSTITVHRSFLFPDHHMPSICKPIALPFANVFHHPKNR